MVTLKHLIKLKINRYNATFIILLCTILSQNNYAQLKLPAVSVADLNQTHCTFDNSANAALLHQAGSSYFEWNNENAFKQITKVYQRYKIYNSSGMQHANITLYYISENSFESIDQITAVSYNLVNNKIKKTKLRKTDIYYTKADNNIVKVNIVIPAVKVGTVFELSYVQKRNSTFMLNPWFFQDNIPAYNSTYTIKYPEFLTYNTLIEAPETIAKKTTTYYESLFIERVRTDYTATAYEYVLKNVPAYRAEPFSMSEKNLKYKIQFELRKMTLKDDDYVHFENWDEVGHHIEEMQRHLSNIEAPIVSLKLTENLNKSVTRKDTVISIATAIRQNISFNNVQDKYAVALSETLKMREANSASLNLLCYNQLRKYNIPVQYMYVYNRSLNKINDSFPSDRLLSSVILTLLINDTIHYIDLTSETAFLSTEVPLCYANTKALKISKDTAYLVELLEQGFGTQMHTAVNCTINDDGCITKSITSFSSGEISRKLNKIERKTTLKSADIFNNNFGKVVFQKIKTKQVQQTLNINCSITDSSNLNQQIVPLAQNYFHEFSNTPFTSNQRQSDIIFPSKMIQTVNLNYVLPENYTIANMPKAVKLSTEKGELFFERSISIEDNVVQVSMLFNLNKSLIPVSDYAMVKTFFETMYEKINEVILLQRK